MKNTEDTLVEQIAEKIRSGEVPRPLTPEALLRETLSAFTPFLDLDRVPLRQHLRLARRVFAKLVADGVVRPASQEPDVSQIRAALRERAAAMPDSPHPQHPLGWVPEDEEAI